MAEGRIGLVLRRPTPSASLDAIARADQHGVSTVWSTVGGTGPDAVTLFAAAATRTNRISFGTSIVPIYPRHPLVLASQVLVLADLAPGRLRLGIGPSHRPSVEDMFGIPFTRPLAYLREYVTVLRRLLWDGTVDFAGDLIKVHGAALPPGTVAPRTPILVSALRSNAFRLAGEVADGAISWVCPVEYLLATALPALQAGAESAGRPVPPLIAHVPVAVSEDTAAIRRAAHKALALYGRLPFYAQMFADAGFAVGSNGELSDRLIDELVVSGTPAAIADRLAAILETGISEVLAMPIVAANQDEEELALIEAIKGL